MEQIKLKLQNELGIQVKAGKDAFTAQCIACKKPSKLWVRILNDGAAYLQCFSSKCELHKHKIISIDNSHNTHYEERFELIPITNSLLKPHIHDGETLYTYKSEDGQSILFYIVRGKDKVGFYPWFQAAEDELVQMDPGVHVQALYRQELLHKKEENIPVLVVEGEKTADAAAKIFTNWDVVSWRGGADRTKTGNWSLLDDRKVIIWPDNDEPGIKAAKAIVASVRTKEMYLIDVSSLEAGADLADNIPLETIKKLLDEKTKVDDRLIMFKFSTVKSLEKALQNSLDSGLKTGYESIDSTLRLPGSGVVGIMGRTGHLKSNFMINLAVNTLRNYTDRIVVYFSLEMAEAEIGIRFLKCLEGKQFSDIGFKDNYLYTQKYLNKELDTYKEYEKYVEHNRLLVTDDSTPLDNILKFMNASAMQGTPLVLFIDYGQLIEVKQSSQRYLEIKTIVEQIRFTANKNNQLIVVGSQVTAQQGLSTFQDQTREGKDIMNTAALILKVWNKRTAAAVEIDDPYPEVNGDLVIHVTKSRQGVEGKKFGLFLTNGVKLVEDFTDFQEVVNG